MCRKFQAMPVHLITLKPEQRFEEFPKNGVVDEVACKELSNLLNRPI